ncbi:MAG: methyl-accepting chemotaxis protein [Gemmatimonadota bacterium]
MMFKRASLGKKLTWGFVIVAAIVAATGIWSYRGLRNTSKAQHDIATVYLPSVNGLWMIKDGQDVIRRVELVMFLPQLTPEEIVGMKKNLANAWELADEGFAIYAPLPKNGPEEEVWLKFKDAWAEFKKIHEDVIANIDRTADEKEAAYDVSSTEVRERFHKARILLDKLLEMNMAASATAVTNSDKEVRFTTVLTLGLVILGVLCAVAVGLGVSRSVSRELGLVSRSLSENSENVLSAAASLSTSANHLSEGASEAAASLEETSASMEELSTMTTQNASNAGQAKSLADQAFAGVEKANVSMGSMVGSMADISSKGEQIQKIVKMIDEIAFQTNLLALNAAVEAARAGEAGAGFAVVADEVRGLARRAAEAAKNTAALIEETIVKINDGTGLVERTNADFRALASAVREVTVLVSEISAASAEQSRGIAGVSTAVVQMDQVTQRNAANAEEIAAAAEQLTAQADTMEAVVARIQQIVRGAGPAEAKVKTGFGARGAKSRPDAAALRRDLFSGPPAVGNRIVRGNGGQYHGGDGKDSRGTDPPEAASGSSAGRPSAPTIQ